MLTSPLPMIISRHGEGADGFLAGLGLSGPTGMIALLALVGAGLAAMLFMLDVEPDDEVEVVVDKGDGVELFGTQGADTHDSGILLLGSSGNDVIEGNAGDDWLWGEAGDDTLRGQADNDVLVGDDGNDTLFGGRGVDILGPNGLFQTDEQLYAEMAGDDTLFGGLGKDTLFDMRGTNTVYGDENGDEIDIRDSREALHNTDVEGAPRTPDLAYGGDGGDVIRLDDGDVAFGGAGADEYIFDMRLNVVDDLDETYITIGDWDVLRDTLIIHDPNNVYESFGEYHFESAPQEGGMWVVLGETRLALLLGAGSVESEFDPTREGGRITIAAPFSL